MDGETKEDGGGDLRPAAVDRMGLELVPSPSHHHHAVTIGGSTVVGGGDGMPLSAKDGGGISHLSSRAPSSFHPHSCPPPPRLLPAFSRPPDPKLPPGVAPVDEFLSLFSTVSAVGLTLLATSLPLQATSREEEDKIRQAIWYYALWYVVCIVLKGLD